MILYFLNGGFFYVGFLAAIMGAAQGAYWWGPLFFLVMLIIHLLFYKNPLHELLFVAVLCILGCATEYGLIRAGLVYYPGGYGFFPPPWLVSIYGMFAMTIEHSLRWLRNHKRASVPLGFIGGIFSYLAGQRLGAAEFLVPKYEFLLAIGTVWSVLTPVSFLIRDRIGPK